MQKKALMAVLATGILACGSAYANLVNDGGFEAPVAGNPFQTIYNPGTMGGWTITTGSVDLIRNYWQPSEGFQSLDLAGNSPAVISQPITASGNLFRLTFDLSGNPDGGPSLKQVQVSFGGASKTFTFDTSVAGNSLSNMKWQTQTWSFTTVDNTRVLSFEDISVGSNYYGPALDNVSLAAVPEPSTVIAGALLLLPFGVSAARGLRKNRE